MDILISWAKYSIYIYFFNLSYTFFLFDIKEFKAFYEKIKKQQLDAASTANKIEKGELTNLDGEINGQLGVKNPEDISYPDDYN